MVASSREPTGCPVVLHFILRIGAMLVTTKMVASIIVYSLWQWLVSSLRVRQELKDMTDHAWEIRRLRRFKVLCVELQRDIASGVPRPLMSLARGSPRGVAMTTQFCHRVFTSFQVFNARLVNVSRRLWRFIDRLMPDDERISQAILLFVCFLLGFSIAARWQSNLDLKSTVSVCKRIEQLDRFKDEAGTTLREELNELREECRTALAGWLDED